VRALVREPSPTLATGLLTHLERRQVDADLARRQWDGYVAALESFDWQLVEVPAAPDHPDSVFVEDTMVVVGDRAIIARPGAPERRGETEAAEATIRCLGFEISRIEPPATLDGGDVLKIGDRLYVGVGGRSTLTACRQLADQFPYRSIIPVPITKVLHLKSAVTALPDGTVIGYPPLLDDATGFERFLPVPEEAGSHVVVIDERTVLMASSAPRSRQLITDHGLSVVAVDISEFQKMEGCVTCLSVRLRD
jgi:dimethylargininase